MSAVDDALEAQLMQSVWTALVQLGLDDLVDLNDIRLRSLHAGVGEDHWPACILSWPGDRPRGRRRVKPQTEIILMTLNVAEPDPLTFPWTDEGRELAARHTAYVLRFGTHSPSAVDLLALLSDGKGA